MDVNQPRVPGAEEEETFLRLYLELRSFAAVVAPPEVEPDDLLQEALAQTLARHRLHELDNPAAYIRRSLTNLAANQRRHLSVRRRLSPRLSPALDLAPCYPSDLADLAQLSPEDRVILYLSVVEDSPVSEVANLLGRSEAAIRMRKHRALRRLGESIAEDLHG